MEAKEPKVGRPRSTDNGKIELDVDRIRVMREAGFCWRQIAEYLDVGVSTVRRRLKETMHRGTGPRFFDAHGGGHTPRSPFVVASAVTIESRKGPSR